MYSGRYAYAVGVWSGIKFFHLKRNYPDVQKSFVLRMLHLKALKLNAKAGHKLRDPMDIANIRRFCAEGDPTISDRDHAMYSALIVLGVRALLRPGELMKMKFRNVKFYEKFMCIDLVTRKNVKQRAAPIYIERATNSKSCPVSLMEKWIAWQRTERVCSQDSLVFSTTRGAQLSYAILGYAVRLVMKGSDEGLHLSGHCMRITGACLMMAAGFETVEIQVMGDWKSNIFLRYLRTMAVAAKRATDRMGF
jgi:site-specific recombinase XerD